MSSPPKAREPGETGYAAHWRYVVAYAGLSALKGQPENVSGKALLMVLKTYGERIDNRSGLAWPKQSTVALEANQSERAVFGALQMAQRLGLLTFVSAAVKNVKGITYRATVPADWETLVSRAMAGLNSQVVAGDSEGLNSQVATPQPASGASQPASTCEQTLTRTLTPELSTETGTLATKTQEDEPQVDAHEASAIESRKAEMLAEALTRQAKLSPEERRAEEEVWGEDESERLVKDARAKRDSGEVLTFLERSAIDIADGLALCAQAPSFD